VHHSLVLGSTREERKARREERRNAWKKSFNDMINKDVDDVQEEVDQEIDDVQEEVDQEIEDADAVVNDTQE